jgi:putative YphP/YqiW family bacilliredoxin
MSAGGELVPYPDFLTEPMREELTRIGFRELKTAADVDQVVGKSDGVVMVVVNSVCGCAAGRARPGIAAALQHTAKPDVLATVFAGADVEATERARQYFAGYPPSSPSLALMKDGELLYMMERKNIEIRSAEEIAAELRAAFDKFCAREVTQS